MPGCSYFYFKVKLQDYLKNRYPNKISILDVGAGEGIYSKLLRGLTYRMDAVEAFPLNIEVEKLHDKYDFVYQKDIVDFKYDRVYDVIIFGDILEHLTVEQSKKVLADALKNSKQVIVAVPYNSKQEEIYGNKYEVHHQEDLTDEVFLQRYPEFETLFKNELYGYYTNKGMVPSKAKRLKLAFLDTIGLRYNGNTLNEKGLGGSESAIIYLGQELTKLGFEVTVFNKCDREGIYDGVEYVDILRTRDNVEHFDILITSRTVLPYVPAQFRDNVLERYPGYDISEYKPLVDRSKYKVLWLHDTFILGEEWVENVLADNYFDEIFTLSDWHSQYIPNARHGQEPRYYESMKRKIFQTRNGIRSYHREVDIPSKDKNLFIYNASTTKGMVPLLDSIWPRVHQEFPNAKLLIIGGYYPGVSSRGPDEIQNLFIEKATEHEGKRGVHFTGIIKQSEVADILLKASYFIYPGAFPETFGISATEALNYNVPLIANRFGALEETAPEATSYLTEYPITRNMSNFNDRGSVADANQVERFMIKVRQAYNDDFLRQQKMNAANEFKPFLGWDTVALQWKHHIYHKLGLYMPRHELEKVRYVTGNLHRLYKRRFFNEEDMIEDYGMDYKNHINIITPVYNAEKYIEDCIRGVASQLYPNYTQYICDDMSIDNTVKVAEDTIASLPESLRKHFVIVKNTQKKYAVGNQVETIQKLKGDSIIALLDGDDRLANDPDIFNYINREYNRGIKFTYGSCYSLADRIPLIAQPYPHEVHLNKSYRQHRFNWGLPYTHLRTFKKSLFDMVDKSAFRDSNGDYWRAGGDNSLFYPLIERCEEHEIKAIQRILVMYNDLNPINDYKVNAVEQNKTRDEIVKNNSKIINNIPTKAYIMRLSNNPLSVQYARQTALSCELIGLPYEYYEGYDHMTPDQLWSKNEYGITSYDKNMHPGAASATAGHFDLWKRIAENNETAIILEHDAIMLHPINISIPDGMIVNLGYKLKDPNQYDYESAGSPTSIIGIKSHLGAHAYAITGMTARMLLDELKTVGVPMAVDNFYFSRENAHQSSIPIGITSPIGAIAWVRKTTIVWDKEEAWEINANFIESFTKHLKTEYKGEIDNYMNETSSRRKRVLIAVPTAKNIETDTFLSIYRLEKPDNVDTHLEFFYGYNIDQVRNLIAHYAIKNEFDYVLFVDSDMVFQSNTLKLLMSYDKDIITGIYIQRRPGQRITEVYLPNANGGLVNVTDPKIFEGKEIMEVYGTGFGCVLVKTQVLRDVGYPQFKYTSSIDFKDTVSEDIDFCVKASKKGYRMYVLPGLLYEHISTIKLKW